MLAHSIDLQSFIIIKNKKRLPRSQTEILKKRVFTKIPIMTASQEEKDDLQRLRAVFDILL
jgi:hypothetical protein